MSQNPRLPIAIQHPDTPVGIGRRYKPFGDFVAKMGIRGLKVMVRLERIMGRGTREKWLVCRDCGFRPDRKLVGRQCSKCGGTLRVIRER